MRYLPNITRIDWRLNFDKTVWTPGIRFAVALTLLVSFGAYRLANYPYYAATLDFSPVDTRESIHDIQSFDDNVASRERLGAMVDWVFMSLSAMPTDDLFTLIILGFFSTPVMIWVMVFFVRGEIRRRVHGQKSAAWILFACGVLPVVVFSTVRLWPGPYIQDFYDKEYLRLTERGEPIIRALASYHRDRGTYPDSLEELVPAYLPEVPLAGILVCPEFVYTNQGGKIGESGQPFRAMSTPNREVESYDLSVSLHKVRSHHAADLFYYLYYQPEQKYSKTHERVEGWAIASSGWFRMP